MQKGKLITFSRQALKEIKHKRSLCTGNVELTCPGEEKNILPMALKNGDYTAFLQLELSYWIRQPLTCN